MVYYVALPFVRIEEGVVGRSRPAGKPRAGQSTPGDTSTEADYVYDVRGSRHCGMR